MRRRGSRRHGKSGEGVCSRVGMGLAGYKKVFKQAEKLLLILLLDFKRSND